MNAKEIRDLRLALGLTQAQMAAKLGVGARMMAYVESGNRTLGNSSRMLVERLFLENNVGKGE